MKYIKYVGIILSLTLGLINIGYAADLKVGYQRNL